jgi:predicted enzyme related to lactoylglutathione lyase
MAEQVNLFRFVEGVDPNTSPKQPYRMTSQERMCSLSHKQGAINMKRVTGVGGIFFKAKDPKALYEWYRVHLGVESSPDAGAMWRDADHPEIPGFTLWTIFPQDTKYFGSPERSFMVNFRVDNLDELLKALREEGVKVDEKVERHEYGNFGWITDPEGNRVELWEPPKDSA